MLINAKTLGYAALNDTIRAGKKNCEITNCLGQRFIGSGMKDKNIIINGVPGNALGAYLNGATIEVKGNVQDAVGDTMNAGKITVHGSAGDAIGYAMRGGTILIKENAGYRAGIHMKAYKEKLPVMVIGGRTGSFLGEYQAGGLIIVLGLNTDNKPIVGNFPCTGMHGGKMFLRSDCKGVRFPSQVTTHIATDEEKAEIAKHIIDYCKTFEESYDNIMSSDFTVVTPDNKNPYKQMYVAN